MHTEFQTYVTG